MLTEPITLNTNALVWYNQYIKEYGVFTKMAMTKVSIRMDEELKKQAEELFDELGLNMTTAFTVFLKKAVREQRIPFEVSADYPNAVTRAAMEETEAILRNPSAYKSYSSAEEMMEDILKDENEEV